MKAKKNKTSRMLKAKKRLELSPRTRATRACLVAGLTLYTLACFMLVAPPPLEANHQFRTGTTPFDSVTKEALGLVVNTGDGSLSVIDTVTNSVLKTIDLQMPGGQMQDVDWGEILQKAVVGGSGGQILTVDPVTDQVLTVANVPGMDFSVMAADDTSPGLVAYSVDQNTAQLVEIQSGGTAVAKGTTPFAIGGATEITEKYIDAANPHAADSWVVAAGKGSVWAYGYDRATGIDYDVVYPSGDYDPTGLTTAAGYDGFISVKDVGGGSGHVLRINIDPANFFFYPAPVVSFGSEEPLDVSVAGKFLTILTDPLSGGAKLTIYDIGDPGNLINVGSAPVNDDVSPFGGLSTTIGVGGSVDDIYFLYVNVGQDATGHDIFDYWEVFVDAPAATVTGSGFPILTGGKPGQYYQAAIPCTDCPPEDNVGKGSVESNTPTTGSGGSVHYATGEEVKVVPIVSVPGVGLDLEINLTYRSRKDYAYRYGTNWFLNQDVRLRTEANGDETLTNGYGRLDTFVLQPGGGGFVPPTHYDTTLNTAGTVTITNRFGTVSTFNAQGYRTSIQDRYGNTITYTWSNDKLTSITDTLNRTYTLSYDGTGRLSSMVDFGGRTWLFHYDYLGQLRWIRTPTSTQFPTGRKFYFSYSPNSATARFRGNLVHAWSGKGDLVQTLIYDQHDSVIQEDLGPGTYTFSYDVPTSTTTVVDRSGNTTKWTFDSIAMPTRKEVFTRGLRAGEPVSYVTQHMIGSNGFIQSTVYPRGNRTDYTYDARLNLVEVRRKETNTATNGPTDIVWTRQFEPAFNQRTQTVDPRGNVTTMTVDGFGNTTQVTRPTITSPVTQSIIETLAYGARGRIASATDGAGRKVTFDYYTTGLQAGYLKTITQDPAGLALVTTYNYDQFGNVTSVTDPKGQVTTLTVDTENYVTEIQAPSPLNYRRRVTYDANRDVTKVEVENVDRKGTQDTTTPWIATTFTYNAVRWLLSRTAQLTSSDSATTEYKYDGSGFVTKVIWPEGNEETIAYDERFLLFTVTRGAGTPDASVARYDYDLNGNLATFTDGRNNPTTFVCDLFDRRTKTTNALGHYIDYSYDKSSNQTAVAAHDSGGALAAKTTRHFDEENRPWKTEAERFGVGLTTTYPAVIVTRDQGHLVTQVKDPLNNARAFSYDQAGRLLTSVDSIGNKLSYTYDSNGNVTKLSDQQVPSTGPAESFVTEYVFDALNRLTELRQVDRLDASNVLSTSFEYDSRNNLVFRTDAEGNPVRWTYDLANRLTKHERALQVGAAIDDFIQSIEQTFSYDANARVTSVSDDNFNSTAYAYDTLDRLIRTTFFDGKFVVRTYDKSSNLSGWTDQNGSVVVNTHDALNRPTARSITRGAGVSGTTQEAYTYDALNRILSAVDDDYQVELTWDSISNLLRERHGYAAVGQEKWKLVQSAYTDAGALSGITYPAGLAIQHTRDAIYRLTSIHDVAASANVATFAWQGTTRLAQTNNQNGTITEYTYDGFQRTSTIDHLLSGGGSLHKFEYLYDKAHNRRMEKNSFSATWIATLPAAVQAYLNGRNGKGDVYAYDRAYRMIEARQDVTNPATEVANPGSQAYGQLVQFTIDGIGNRSQLQTTPPTPPTTVTYSSDVVNQYTQVGTAARIHDNNGNLTDDATQLYVYDYKNRVVEAKVKSTGATIAAYKYDAFGRRVEKTLNGAGTTRYVLCRQQVITEYDGSDAWQADYVYEDGIDRPRSMDRADIADVNGNANTTEVLRFHYHQNAQTSTSEITQPTGAVVEWTSYDAYGKPTVRDQNGAVVAQSAIGSPYLYTGREYDGESGLYHYRARSYDPESGRFLQRDPAGYVDGLSLYEYARSSPSVLSDPLGRNSLKEAHEDAKFHKDGMDDPDRGDRADYDQFMKELEEEKAKGEDADLEEVRDLEEALEAIQDQWAEDNKVIEKYRKMREEEEKKRKEAAKRREKAREGGKNPPPIFETPLPPPMEPLKPLPPLPEPWNPPSPWELYMKFRSKGRNINCWKHKGTGKVRFTEHKTEKEADDERQPPPLPKKPAKAK